MCNFLSGYCTEKRGLRCSPFVDSHSDQIIMFGDTDLDSKLPLEILKWEITPPRDWDKFFDSSAWYFRIDQDEIPSWADPKMAEHDVREYLQKLLDDCPDIGDEIKILDGRYIALRGDGVVTKCSDATYIKYIPNKATINDAGSATIKYAGAATINDAGYATIKYAGSATIKYAGAATINDAGYATINDAGYATIKYAGAATINDAGYATINDAGYATIKYAGYATINDAGYATINDAGYATIDDKKHINGEPIEVTK